jgi:hypothetical protein
MAVSQKNPEWMMKFIGILIGLMLWLLWAFLIFALGSISIIQNNQLTIRDPFGAWIFLGPLPLIVGAGLYYFTRTYWPDLKRQQQFAVLEGGSIGFFVWTVLVITIPEIKTANSIFPDLAGWLFMLVIMLYFRWRSIAGTGSPE